MRALASEAGRLGPHPRGQAVPGFGEAANCCGGGGWGEGSLSRNKVVTVTKEVLGVLPCLCATQLGLKELLEVLPASKLSIKLLPRIPLEVHLSCLLASAFA